MKRHEIPSLERLDEVFLYAPETGVLRWRVRRSGTAKAGSVAGTLDHATGGIAVTLDGHRYQAHHLIWYLQHRVWPIHQILFRDKDPTNLRLTNLYSVEEVYSDNPKAIYARRRRERRIRIRTEKQELQRLRQPQTISDITFNDKDRKWRVMSPVDNRKVVRQFDNPDDARAFALERERILNWLRQFEENFKYRPTDDVIRSGTDVYAETYAEIAQLVAYNPDTGEFYFRNTDHHGQLRADFTSTTGRRVVTLYGRYFSVAMLAWFLTYRQWPKPKSIGWRDGDKTNNKLSNLMLLKVQK